MNKYEAIYIIDTAVEEMARKELIAKFNDVVTANGGTLEKVDEWGKRRLAYTIDYKTEGYYVLLHFTAVPELPKELERVLQINENILRYLIVKLEQKRSSVKPRAIPVRPAPSFAPPELPVATDAAPTTEAAAPAAVAAAAVAAAPVEAIVEAVAAVKAEETVAEAVEAVAEVAQEEEQA